MNVFGVVITGGVVCFVIVCGGGGVCTHGIVIPMNESAVSITHRNCKKRFVRSEIGVIHDGVPTKPNAYGAIICTL